MRKVHPDQVSMFADNIPVENRLTSEVKQALEQVAVIAFDIETSSVDFSDIKTELGKKYFQDKGKLGLSYCAKLILLSLWCPEYPQGVALTEQDLKDNLVWLQNLFNREDILFVGHNLVFDLRLLVGKYKLPIPPRIWDTMTVEILFADGDPGSEKKIRKPDEKSYSLFWLTKHYDLLQYASEPIALEYIEYLYSQTLPVKRRKELLKDKIPTPFKELSVAEFYAVYKDFKTKQRTGLDELPTEYRYQAGSKYAILDTLFTYYLQKRQEERIEEEVKNGYTHLRSLVDWENRFSRVCASMAANGIHLNMDFLGKKYLAWQAELEDYRQQLEQIAAEAGYHFEHFNPALQAVEETLLYQVFKIKVPEYTAQTTLFYTEKHKPTFNDFTLPYYAKQQNDPRILLMMKYQTTQALMGKALEFLAHAACDGKIHPTIVARTVTGRTSADTPNTQNVKITRTWEDEHWHDSPFTGMLAYPEDRLINSLDIVNAEMWMSGIVAGDDVQIEALLTGDAHAYSARTYFSDSYDPNLGPKEGINYTLRSLAKTVNFGTAYGMGAVKLINSYPSIAKMMSPTEEQLELIKQDEKLIWWCQNTKPRILPDDLKQVSDELWTYVGQIANARQLLSNKDNTYLKTTLMKKKAMELAERDGYVQIWSGRRCFVREVEYFDDKLKRFVKKRESKNAWNTHCQGGVGEVTRRWAVLTFEAFERYGIDACLVNYVHDEIVLEYPLALQKLCDRIAVNSFYRALDTIPPDGQGRNWFDRTTPRAKLMAGVDHKDNSQKWGYVVDREYPVDKMINFDQPDFDEETSLAEQMRK